MTEKILTKCDKCLKSRIIVSENGPHGICTLPPKAATDCITGKKDRFLTLDEWNEAIK